MESLYPETEPKSFPIAFLSPPAHVITPRDGDTRCSFKHCALCEKFIFGTQLSDPQGPGIQNKGKIPELVNVKKVFSFMKMLLFNGKSVCVGSGGGDRGGERRDKTHTCLEVDGQE